MASSVRSLRQGRSAKVSYKDSLSEEDDEVYEEYPDGFFPPDAVSMLASPKPVESRRNLALKKINKSKEREDPKERAEAAPIHRSIEGSLSQERARRSNANEIAIVDSEEDTPVATPNGATDFEAVVESATEQSCKQTEDIHGEAEQIVQYSKTKSTSQNKKKVEKDLEWSDGDDEEYEEDDDSEDEYCDFSDDSGCKRKRTPKSQAKKGKNSVDRKAKNVQPNLAVKKPRTTKPTSKFESPTTVASSAQSGLQAKAISIKAKNEPAKALMADKKAVGKAVPLSKCLESPFKFQKTPPTKTSPLGITSPKSSVIFDIQSPSLVHRRVIGLSRRFRPPPLHPYLSKTET